MGAMRTEVVQKYSGGVRSCVFVIAPAQRFSGKFLIRFCSLIIFCSRRRDPDMTKTGLA